MRQKLPKQMFLIFKNTWGGLFACRDILASLRLDSTRETPQRRGSRWALSIAAFTPRNSSVAAYPPAHLRAAFENAREVRSTPRVANRSYQLPIARGPIE